MRDADEAVKVAGELGYPVALKILSPDISHKSDVGGVALDPGRRRSGEEGGGATCWSDVAHVGPQARIEGFTVQPMVRPSARS